MLAAVGTIASGVALPAKQVLGRREIHLWTIDLASARRDTFQLVSDAEVQRSLEMAPDEAGLRFLLGRAALRRVLGGYLGANPQALIFHRTEMGKPFLKDAGGLAFSFSRSGRLGLLAVALDRELGVDLERLRPEHQSRVDECYLSAAESAAIAALPPSEAASARTSLWTLKEAYLKYTGRGLAVSPAALDMAFALPAEQGRIVRRAGANWSLVKLTPREGYTTALAFGGLDARLSFMPAGSDGLAVAGSWPPL